MNALTRLKHLFFAIITATLVSSCASLNSTSSSEDDDMYYTSKDRQRDQQAKKEEEERKKASRGRVDTYNNYSSTSQTQQNGNQGNNYSSGNSYNTTTNNSPGTNNSNSSGTPAQTHDAFDKLGQQTSGSSGDVYSGNTGYRSNYPQGQQSTPQQQSQGQGGWNNQGQQQHHHQQQQQANNNNNQSLPTAKEGRPAYHDTYQPETQSSTSKAEVHEYQFTSKRTTEGNYNPHPQPVTRTPVPTPVYDDNYYIEKNKNYIPLAPLYPGFNPYGAFNIIFGYYPWHKGPVFDPYFYPRYNWGKKYGYRTYLSRR